MELQKLLTLTKDLDSRAQRRSQLVNLDRLGQRLVNAFSEPKEMLGEGGGGESKPLAPKDTERKLRPTTFSDVMCKNTPSAMRKWVFRMSHALKMRMLLAFKLFSATILDGSNIVFANCPFL